MQFFVTDTVIDLQSLNCVDSDGNTLKTGGKSTGSLSAGASPLMKTRLSSSHPDLSSLRLLQPDERPDYPEHSLKVFKSDHSCRYLLIHKVRHVHCRCN